ncbi:hypothetical protein BKA65DRAFT_81680 [Rhexocercosporidium sp. MPI-PUGE-AT-0058]|nr:hypothetical protein BKA65DRAFT_81680 [Rhexocercosporidium sp. MPI-PUGE-AT-0058]
MLLRLPFHATAWLFMATAGEVGSANCGTVTMNVTTILFEVPLSGPAHNNARSGGLHQFSAWAASPDSMDMVRSGQCDPSMVNNLVPHLAHRPLPALQRPQPHSSPLASLDTAHTRYCTVLYCTSAFRIPGQDKIVRLLARLRKLRIVFISTCVAETRV